jgi:hypothetical protein
VIPAAAQLAEAILPRIADFVFVASFFLRRYGSRFAESIHPPFVQCDLGNDDSAELNFHARYTFIASARVSALSHIGLCCHIWVSVTVLASKRSVFRSLHGLLGYQRSSALFRPVCLSSTCLSIT